jgi:hypothetical protein
MVVALESIKQGSRKQCWIKKRKLRWECYMEDKILARIL